jgi:thioredoxin-related protein
MIFQGFVRHVWIGAILACATASAVGQSAGVLRFAEDLAATGREASERRAPIMIAFTEATCIYCDVAKRDYLVPMQNSAELRDKVIIVEIDVESRANLRDFEGRTVTRKEFSKRYKVQRVPTVVVVDESGQPLAAPIVGLLGDDFYRLYLQQAIEEGLYKLRHSRRTNQ